MARNALQYGGSDSDNPLSAAPWTIPDPSDPTAPMSQGAAVTQTASAVDQWMEAQRQKSAQMGLWNDQTGLPTMAGLFDAGRQFASNFEGGIKVTPRLTPAIRYGDQVFTGSDHTAIGRDHPEIGTTQPFASELGFIDAAGRWLPRPAAFKYALQNDLIDPKRSSEAERFYNAMDESGNMKNLFLPSEWLKKYGLAGLMAGGGAAATQGQPQQ